MDCFVTDTHHLAPGSERTCINGRIAGMIVLRCWPSVLLRLESSCRQPYENTITYMKTPIWRQHSMRDRESVGTAAEAAAEEMRGAPDMPEEAVTSGLLKK